MSANTPSTRSEYWRSLEELAAAEAVAEAARDEFPGGPPDEGLTRRGFLTLLGAGLAAAGCSRAPRERIPVCEHHADHGVLAVHLEVHFGVLCPSMNKLPVRQHGGCYVSGRDA